MTAVYVSTCAQQWKLQAEAERESGDYFVSHVKGPDKLHKRSIGEMRDIHAYLDANETCVPTTFFLHFPRSASSIPFRVVANIFVLSYLLRSRYKISLHHTTSCVKHVCNWLVGNLQILALIWGSYL